LASLEEALGNLLFGFPLTAQLIVFFNLLVEALNVLCHGTALHLSVQDKGSSANRFFASARVAGVGVTNSRRPYLFEVSRRISLGLNLCPLG
jgi:hypothetical protein